MTAWSTKYDLITLFKDEYIFLCINMSQSSHNSHNQSFLTTSQRRVATRRANIERRRLDLMSVAVRATPANSATRQRRPDARVQIIALRLIQLAPCIRITTTKRFLDSLRLPLNRRILWIVTRFTGSRQYLAHTMICPSSYVVMKFGGVVYMFIQIATMICRAKSGPIE